jgi:putative phosphoesterase
MKIGILSDTHGNLPATVQAARLLEKAGAAAVFHCGDIGGYDVLSELAAVFQPCEVPVYAVLGNIDIYSSDWKFFPSNVGVQLLGRYGEVEFAGRRIALLHSDDRLRYHQATDGGAFDLVFSGHTHEVHDFMVRQTRCINPGTAGRGAPGTCASLDLESGRLSVFECTTP